MMTSTENYSWKRKPVEFPTLFPEDEIVVFMTSGSTGKPKLVPKPHFQAINNRVISTWKAYNDRSFAWVGGSPILTVFQGEPRVFCDSSIAPEGHNTMKMWEVIKDEQCNSAVLLPYFLSDLVAHEKKIRKICSNLMLSQQVGNPLAFSTRRSLVYLPRP